MSDLVFHVEQEADGGFVAECLTEGIYTQGDTWEELRANVREAVGGSTSREPRDSRDQRAVKATHRHS